MTLFLILLLLCVAYAARVQWEHELEYEARDFIASLPPSATHVIVTASDWTDVETLTLFMLHLDATGEMHYLILCHENRTLQYVRDWTEGGRGMFVPELGGVRSVHAARHVIIRELLYAGFAVVNSDLDVAWMRAFPPSFLPVGDVYFATNASVCIITPSPLAQMFYGAYVRALLYRAPRIGDDKAIMDEMIDEEIELMTEGSTAGLRVKFLPTSEFLGDECIVGIACACAHMQSRSSVVPSDFEKLFAEVMEHGDLAYSIFHEIDIVERTQKRMVNKTCSILF